MNYTAMQKLCGAVKDVRKFPFTDARQLENWQEKARKQLNRLLNVVRDKRLSPPVFNGREIFKEHIREHWSIETEHGICMPFYLLIPQGKGPFPPAIAVHGHGFGAKEGVAGCSENPVIAAAAAEYNAGFGLELVRRGFLTAVPDVRGFGERREKQHLGDEKVLESSCNELSLLAIGAGRTLAGMFVTDLAALADFLLGREDAAGDLSCVGLSGGGLQTLLFSALDERVKNAVVSGFFYGAKKALFEMPQCACNYAPGLWSDFEMCDIAAMIAPRRLFIETGDNDPLNGGLENALAEGRAAAEAYRIAGAEENFRQQVYGGGHRFYGIDSLSWLERAAKGMEK